MNPYASHLDHRSPLQIIGETPGRLGELIGKLGADGTVRVPKADKWSTREILCHLADTELAFAFRLRQALAEPHHVIQPFDQEKWAAHYPAFDARAALEAFTAVRFWNMLLLQSLAPEDFSRVLTHPERGEMTFQTLVETMAGHDVNHLRQIELMAADVQPA